MRRKRRRQVYKNIWRTFVWTLGLSLATAFVGYVVWFRFGWEDLPLRCYDDTGWPGWQELSGELQPQAADSFEVILRALYGEAAVKRVGVGRIMVRPAVIYFDDNDRLRDLTTLLTRKFTVARGNVTAQTGWVSDCRRAQYQLFAGGKARSCWDPWEPHIFGIIEQDSWPWLSRMLGVQVPALIRVAELVGATPLVQSVDPPHLASQVVPDEIACGPTFHVRVWFYKMFAVAVVVYPVMLLWPF